MKLNYSLQNKLSKSELKKGKILIALLFVVYFLMGYHLIFSDNVKESGYLLIPHNSSFESISDSIKPFLKDVSSFNRTAKLRAYSNKIRSGRYSIEKGMSNNAIITKLKGGHQEALTFIFNNENSLELLAGTIASKIEPDSVTVLKALRDSLFLEAHQLNQVNVLSIFIPNSYNIYWNISAEKFRDKMFEEYQKFWQTDNRMAKANALQLNPTQVYTLASIVQKETATIKERPIVAGLYLNRLKKGWPLQADPTIIFALKQSFKNDTIIKRVFKKDLLIKSAFNTYSNTGLPPGPIAMPDVSSIDAVLNPAKHNYLFMCASTVNFGSHEFAEDLKHHLINAEKYQKWIDKQGVKR